MATWRRFLVTVALASVAAVATPVSAETPTAVDFAACNTEAKGAMGPSAATPTTKDYMHAAAARQASAATPSYPSDPQRVGMETERTTEAAYQAAYRTCMRRSGF